MRRSENGSGPSKPLCPSCGAPAVGEFADCQEMFDHFLARSFSDLTYGGFHRVFVDLYSLQHPDKYCDSAKSLAAHLTGLCCVMEHDGDVRVNAALRKWLNGRMELEKPAMPEGRGDATIDRFVGMDDADVAAKFEEWCAEVWDAHSERHELALRWISLAFGD